MTNKIVAEKSSGNIFDDLGLDNSEELQARGMVGIHVFKLLKEKDLKQREIADLLGVTQTEVSHLMNGHFSRFTVDKLLEFLKSMNQQVTIQISPRGKGEPYQQVAFA